MKVVQALGWYFPESTGGTETYVRGLASCLRPLGFESVVAAPQAGNTAQTYDWEGTSVHRHGMPAGGGRAVLRGLAPPPGLDEFTRWLRNERAQIYHQHSLTTGCGLHHLRKAKALGLPTVLTVHVPGPVCPRGTMMLMGQAPCDGRLEERRCSRCWLEARGAPPLLAASAASLPAGPGRLFWRLGRAGSLLGTSALVRQHRVNLLEAASLSDRIVAVCAWLREALLLNGVPASKVTLQRQGVDPGLAASSPGPRARDAEGLTVGFLGRWDPVKGLHVLVRAIRMLPAEVPVRLRVHATNAHAAGAAEYRREVEALAGDDPRIEFRPPLEAACIGAFLQELDLLAVPSQWLETGPLVVLEAFAAGTPVLGSRLGGIAELVDHGTQGLLLPHDDPAEWSRAIQSLLAPGRLQEFRRHLGPVRTMREAAEETAALYGKLLRAHGQPSRPH